MSITAEDVCRFLEQSVQDLNHSVDESERKWMPAMVRHHGSAISMQKTTRPDFDKILDRWPLEDKPAIKVFAHALEKDGRYRKIVERFLEAKPGLFSYFSLQVGHIAINTLKEYLWMVGSLALDGQIAREVSKNLINSLDSQS